MPCFTAMRAEIALMSGSAFAVTHHAFSSGAGRTSDGNGSHASTLKSPSYTKSVSWQHYRKSPHFLTEFPGWSINSPPRKRLTIPRSRRSNYGSIDCFNLRGAGDGGAGRRVSGEWFDFVDELQPPLHFYRAKGSDSDPYHATGDGNCY
ncbi:putative transposase [Shigella flexneri K-1770]|nr:putative transposase [Shigella flexneri VA-6]EIQ02631.1 putative transposase [Shigella flexneri K-1770]